jgi:hypothetical protein
MAQTLLDGPLQRDEYPAVFAFQWYYVRLTSLGPEVAFFYPKVFPVILSAAPYLGFLEPDLFTIGIRSFYLLR